MNLPILHETNDWFVVNKPAQLHTVNLKTSVNSLETEVLKVRPHQSSLPEAGIVHRLDFDTSGCVLIAKTKAAYETLVTSIRGSSEIQKAYWAIVNQKPAVTSFDFYFSSRYRGSKKVSALTKGKESERGQCLWKILFEDSINLVLEVQLVGGGQRHQIRAGLAKVGSPILGDILYGGNPWPNGIALHARRLMVGGVLIEAPPPLYWPKTNSA